MELNLNTQSRIELCKYCIYVLEKVDDERKESALEYYRNQLKELEEKLENETPKDIVIGLKPAVLFGDTSGG